ncbi:MAG TPA: copper-containing nitrite reductase [Candidatus Angelobacter sp.]|nr:copper-containing nitrite reductase [Candidatus Angelobacter sp.]
MRYLISVVIILAIVFSANISHGASSAALQNVAVQNEEASWTHAPNVPPPIKRTDPRLVVVHWEAKETKIELTPGMVYDTYWTIEGTVPGPLLRVREGDTVEIHLKNSAGNSHPHNIDFHFVAGPGGGAGALTVMPGEEAVLRVKATTAGFYMYHCAASESIPTHIANGMYGFVLVDPANGLPDVDHEWYVVQSEFYADQRTAGHLTFSFQKGMSERPDYVFWNGRFGALSGENALHAKAGERIRLYVGNAGPNLVSSFHVIGAMFDSVYREGDLISPPARGIQTTLIPSGGSSVVEFTAHVPGAYLLVDHSIFRIMKGAIGQIMVQGSATNDTQANEFYDPVVTHAAAMGGHDMKGAAPAPPPLEEPEHAASGSARNVSTAAKSGSTVTIPYNASIQSMEKDHYYNPGVITVPKGAAVTWNNKDMMGHELIFDTVDLGSGPFNPGAKWKHAFTAPGKYPYHCKPHPWMKGMIVVSDSAAPMVASNSDADPQPSASDGPEPAAPQAPASATLRLLGHAATPNLITVREGGTVTFVNSDNQNHEVMFDSWSWDFRYVDPGLILKPGEKWSHTFTTAGTFSYHCRRHPWIKGRLSIKNDAIRN